MNFKSGPLPKATPAPAKQDSSRLALEKMLQEAKDLLNDGGTTKSQSAMAQCRLTVRLIETQLYGAPQTPLPQLHLHPEDDEPRPAASLPRRL
jgi:hypothetical protein